MDITIAIPLAAIVIAISQTTVLVFSQRSSGMHRALEQCLRDLDRAEDTIKQLRERIGWLEEKLYRDRREHDSGEC